MYPHTTRKYNQSQILNMHLYCLLFLNTDRGKVVEVFPHGWSRPVYFPCSISWLLLVCQWPGDAWGQDISSHGIHLVFSAPEGLILWVLTLFTGETGCQLNAMDLAKNHNGNANCFPWCMYRDQSSYVPSQWEMLQCNNVSHWLGAYLDWSLMFTWSPFW